jgi:hypothetical protein
VVIATRTCAHAAATYAQQTPGVPCDACRAWIDSDGSPMTAAVALARYPELQHAIDHGRYDGSTHTLAVSAAVGKIAGSRLGAAFALVALALLIVEVVAIVNAT